MAVSYSKCTVAGCDREHLCKGFCDSHYRRFRTHGDPLGGRPPNSTVRSPSRCSVDACGRDHYAKGFCRKHHSRFESNGDATTVLKTPRDEPLRFIHEIKATDECIIWPYKHLSNGYGQLRINGRVVSAHRYSLEHHSKESCEGWFVLHSCDDPRCVNPAHLRLGTALDNANDAVSRGRNSRGEAHGNSRLTDEIVREIIRIRSEVGATHREIAETLNVSVSRVSYVLNGNGWRHVSRTSTASPNSDEK